MLKEEPLLCEDNTDTVTFNKHIFPLGNSNCKEVSENFLMVQYYSKTVDCAIFL